jgi:CO/xanthine dehydrogenase Mo-binding subunit
MAEAFTHNSDGRPGSIAAGDPLSSLSRRAFLSAGGALVVTLAAPAEFAKAATQPAPNGLAVRPPIHSGSLSSYISIDRDGTVWAYYGKIESGQGLETTMAQLVAEEIDVPWEKVRLVIGDTARTVNMGGATAGNAVRQAGPILRQTAAEARRLLIEMAARTLGVPAPQLTVTDGIVHAVTDPAKRISYAELIGGRHFDASIEWDGVGSDLWVKVQAPLKQPSEFKIIGKPFPRRDMAGKVFGTLEQCTDVKLPNMLHARMIRPRVAGAVPVEVDEASIAGIPGAQVVRIKDLLAVVAEKEWNAIRAARALRVTWSQSAPNFPGHEQIPEYIRNASVLPAPAGGGGRGGGGANAAAALADGFRRAARIVEHEYYYPTQSHASMGPACGIADVRDGAATVWTSTQKPYDCAGCVAQLLELPPEKVRAIWIYGTAGYARNDQGDAVADAAVLSKQLGRPVRVQYMRDESLGWDPKGPPVLTRMRAGLDASGNVIAFEHLSKGFSTEDCNTREEFAGDVLAGHLTGVKPNFGVRSGRPGNNYVFDASLVRTEVIAPLLERASPLRTTHVRDPNGPPHLFGMESFIDEIAAETGIDPVALRLRHLKTDRERDVIEAAARQYGWDTRPSPKGGQTDAAVAVGRGIAYRQMHETYVAIVAEVGVHRESGAIEVRRLVCAHDCGMVVNPRGIRHVIECQLIWQLGRTLYEEVQFDANMVTSVDWASYPVLKMDAVPKAIEIVIIDRPEVWPASGAAEHSCGPIPAAIANAVFDATGVRLRRAPFRPDRVKAELVAHAAGTRTNAI